MDLHALPQFTVLAHHGALEEGHLRLVGRLSHVAAVRNVRGALYISATTSLLGDLDRIPEPGEPVTFHALSWAVLPATLDGVTFPWLDGYWEPYQVAMILDPEHPWERRVFIAEPAHYFDLNGVRGWQKVGGAIPDGARDLGVRPGNWDHEHCDLCRARIGTSGAPEGYVDEDDHWLCTACYNRHAVPRDISFVTDA